MAAIWHKIKGYIAGGVAFIACPCHLLITLPLLITLTAGTALGVWLENNTLTVIIISTVIFIGGVALALRWTGVLSSTNDQINVCPTQNQQSSQPVDN